MSRSTNRTVGGSTFDIVTKVAVSVPVSIIFRSIELYTPCTWVKCVDKSEGSARYLISTHPVRFVQLSSMRSLPSEVTVASIM